MTTGGLGEEQVRRLFREVARLVDLKMARQGPVLRHARVTGTDPLEVQFPGDDVPVPVALVAAGLSPQVGDLVVAERVESSWLVAFVVVEA